MRDPDLGAWVAALVCPPSTLDGGGVRCPSAPWRGALPASSVTWWLLVPSPWLSGTQAVLPVGQAVETGVTGPL